MQHHTLETIYTLLSASTTPKQNIRVEIKKLLPLIAQLDPINYLDYYQEIMLLIQQIEQETQQKQTAEKTIIGVGGGFSAGKSRFINSLLAIEALPEALEPCTAVATYLSASQQEQTHALNLLNHHISLKSEQLGQLRHFVGDNSTQNDIQLGELIQHVHLGIPQLKWEHIAFLDTPGYSKADSEHHHHSDEKLAINQLSKTDYIIWLVNAKNGTIRDEDLQFLQKITPKEPVFVVLTQSDLVNRSDIEPILKSVRKNLKSRNIKIAGLMAWAAPIMKLEGERLAGDDIQQWLNSINQPIQHHTIEKLETLIQNILSIGSNQTKQLDKEIETLNIIKNKQKDAIKTNVLIQSKKLNKEAQIESNCALALQMANIYEHLFENLLGASKFHVMIIDYLLRFLDSSNDDGNIKYFLKEHTLGSSSLNWLYTKSLSDVTSVKTEFERLVNRSEHKELQYKYAILLEKQQNIESAIEYMFFSAKQNFSLAYDWLINYAEKLNIEAQFKITELFKIGVEKDASNVFNYCYNAIRYNNDLRFLKFLQSQAIDEKNKHAQYLLAICYTFGYGVTIDYKEAYKLYCKTNEGNSIYNKTVIDYFNQGIHKKNAIQFIKKNKIKNNINDLRKILSFRTFVDPILLDYRQNDAKFKLKYFNIIIGFIFIILTTYIFILTFSNQKVQYNLGRYTIFHEYWYEKSASQGNIDAMLALGKYYELKADSLSMDKAIYWYKKLVDIDNSEAMFALAKIYEDKNDKNLLEQAINLYIKLANQDNKEAIKALISIDKKKGQFKNVIFWYQKLVRDEKNNEIYEKIKKYKNDFENKVLWLIKAEEKGDIFAQITLASYYEIRGNEKKAFDLYKKPVTEQHAQYIIDIAKSYYALKDMNNALLWYKKSAHLGSVDSINFLVSFYEKDKELQKMLYWLKVLADLGYVDAIEQLAQFYTINKNYDQAILWYKKAFELGEEYQYSINIGDSYYFKNDIDEAEYWYQQAANYGVDNAEEKLLLIEEARQKIYEQEALLERKEQEKIERTGLWKDPSTNKTWMRCSLGQIWTGNDCEDSAQTYTWEQAKSAIEGLNEQSYAGYSDWRLPNIEELKTLIYQDEVSNTVVYNYPSNTLIQPYGDRWGTVWSATPYQDRYALTAEVYENRKVFFSAVGVQGRCFVRAVRSNR